MRGRIGSAMNDPAVSHETVDSAQLVEVPPSATGGPGQGSDQASSSSMKDSTSNAPKSLPTLSSPEAEKRKWRQQLFREYGGAPRPTPISSVGRKRANSVDATSSRPDDSKRHRGTVTPSLARTSISNTAKLELPSFPAQGSDRLDLIVIDDDDDEYSDEGAAWFDYVGPKKEPDVKDGGQGPTTDLDSHAEDDPLKARASKRASDKARKDAEKKTEKVGTGAAGGAKTGRKKQRKATARKPKPDKTKKDDAKSDLKQKNDVSEADDRESEDERAEPPWQGPINLEPFDGGFGLPDEVPADERNVLLYGRLFPSGGSCTDEYWKLRTRVSILRNNSRCLAHNPRRATSSSSLPTPRSPYPSLPSDPTPSRISNSLRF